MTSEEFKTWFSHHRACFPGIDSWLGKIDAAAKSRSENPLTSTEVLRQWYGALREWDLDDCKKASSAMHRGDVDLPKSFDDHPRTIRRVISKTRAAFIPTAPVQRRSLDGEPIFNCKTCLDDGLMIVFHPKTVGEIRAGKEVPLHLAYNCGVRCPCRSGSHKFGRLEPVFDESQMVVCNWHLVPEDMQRLREVVASEQRAQPWNPDDF